MESAFLKKHCRATVRSHATKPIRRPKLDKDTSRYQEGQSLVIHFDGGKNCIGFILYQVDGSPYAAVGNVNKQWSTNNLAELAALE